MLIVYFVLYRLSNCFNRLQGYFSHSKQNLDWLSFIISQFLIMAKVQKGLYQHIEYRTTKEYT